MSDLEGELEILPPFIEGSRDIAPSQRIVVLFHFHRSPGFAADQLRQITRRSRKVKGVFSICSPKRPNPIGLSVLEVRAVAAGRIAVRGLDMYDGTPILDIKPYASIDPPR